MINGSFHLYIWYIVQSSGNIFIFSVFFIDLLIIESLKEKKNNTDFYMHTRNLFVPSRNYLHVHGNVLHAYALQFLVLYNLFPLCITAIYSLL